MKKFTLTSLALALMFIVGGTAFAQQEYAGPGMFMANEAQLFKTFTNYLTTSDDSTGFITFDLDNVIRDRILLAREVRVLAVATDSIYVAFNWIGYNGRFAGTTFYSEVTGDSMYYDGVGAVYSKIFTIKSPTVDRLAGATKMKVEAIFGDAATHQGFTAGRTLKLYLLIVR